MLGPLLAGDADVVYGSRFLSGQPHRVLYYWHSVGNRLLTTASNMFTNLNLTDMETCYKAFRREVIQSIEIEEDRFGFEPEITAKIAARRLADLRGRHLVLGPHLRRGQEDRVEGRRPRDLRRRALLDGVAAACARRIDHAPDRSIPPAEFDDSDAELSDVLSHARGSRQLRRLDLRADPAAPRRATCSRSAPATASSPSACAATRTSPRPTSRSAASTRSRERFAGNDEVEVLQADVAALGAEDRRFDSVVLINVLEHIDDDVERARRPARAAEAGRPALRVRARVRRAVLGLRPPHRAPPPLPAVAARHDVRPGRARRGRRPLREHRRRAGLVVVLPPARPGPDPALVGEALRPRRRSR